MKNNGYKPRVPDIMEAVFDIGYLLFDLIAAVLFFLRETAYLCCTAFSP